MVSLATGKCVYSWPVAFNDFSKLSKTIGELTYSATFKIGEYTFRVHIYPGGDTEDSKEYVSVFLILWEPLEAKIKYNLSVLVDTKKRFSGQLSTTEFHSRIGVGRHKFVKYTALGEDVLSVTSDQLVVLVELFDLDVSISQNHLQKLRNYEEYMNNEKYSDVKIVVHGQTIFAHKVILTCGNKVFTAMFAHDLKESKENTINIEDISFDVMLELVRFIYTGQVCDVEKMPKELLIASDKYGVDDLKIYCEKYLCQLISVKNVLDYLSFSDKYNVCKLRTDSITFLMTHRKDVAKTPEFESTLKMMNADLVIEILKTTFQS